MKPQYPSGPIPEMMTWAAIVTQLYSTALTAQLVPLGLTPAQLSVLSHLARRTGDGAGLRVTDIARAVQVLQPAVTKMLVKFDSAGWITLAPDKSDKRGRTARITPLGLRHLGTVQASLFPGLKGHLSDWSAEDFSRFTTDLRRFARVLDKMRQLDGTAPSGLTSGKQTGH